MIVHESITDGDSVTTTYGDAYQLHRFAVLHEWTNKPGDRWLVVIIASPGFSAADTDVSGTKKIMWFAGKLGYRGVAVLALSSVCGYRARRVAYRADPHAPENYTVVHAVLSRKLGAIRRASSIDVLCAWGYEARGREKRMEAVLRAYQHPVHVLGFTRTGQPRSLFQGPLHGQPLLRWDIPAPEK